MPDGQTHDAITLVTASFMTPICYGLVLEGEPGQATLFLGSYLVSGLLFSDDLDIDSIEYKRWWLFRFLWLPYQKLVPHRSWLSHGLLIGPLVRILYFAGMCTLILWLALTALSRIIPLDASGLVGSLLSALARSIVTHPEWWTVAFIGFVLGSVVHVISDSLWTWWRRAWRAPVPRVQPQATAPTHHGVPMPDFVQRISVNIGNGGNSPSP